MSAWAVVCRRGKSVDVWAVIVDVPESVKRAQVLEAIEQSRQWPSWQRRVEAGASIGVTPQTRWRGLVAALGERHLDEDLTIPWSALAADERAITIVLPAAVHAKIRQRAALYGLSMTAWITNQLEEAVNA